MKLQEYTAGERSKKNILKTATGKKMPTQRPFAELWPQSSSIIDFDAEWFEFDEKDVGCQIRSKTARAIVATCIDYIDFFHPDRDNAVTLKNLISKDCAKPRNQRTVLMLAGSEVDDQVQDKLSNVVGFVAERLIQDQGNLFFTDDSRGLSVAEIGFLLERIDKIRIELSGSNITHPFAVETLGVNSTVSAFSGRFDDYQYELPPAVKISGDAVVDGLREHHNSVYLSLLEDDMVIDVSKPFIIQDTKLLRVIAEAKHIEAQVTYVAEKIFEKTPDKPTFVLKSVEIVR